MGSLTIRGWQKSAKNAPQPTGIVTGANLRKPSKPENEKKESKPTQQKKPD